MPEPTKTEPRVKTLSNTDGDLLERYFCKYKSAFSRSITGPMLSKAELYSSSTYPCYWCAGDFPGIQPNGEWCKRCAGTGFVALTLKPKEECTARPTAEVVEAKGYEPDHSTLQEYGRVSRRLDAVATKAGKKVLRALEEYHGDAGARWGRTRWGRVFCLYHLTPSGRRLLINVATEENNEVSLTPTERLGVQAELQRVKPSELRRTLLAKALAEAEALYQQAVDAWIETAPLRKVRPEDSTKKPEHLPKRENEKWVPDVTPAHQFYGDDGFQKLRQVVGKE